MHTSWMHTRHIAKQVKNLMTFSAFSLHHCTLATSLPSTNTHFLKIRRQLPLPFSLSTVRMSFTATQGGNNIITNDLEPIFKQKRVIRSKVRKLLKEMDPSKRALEDDAIQRLVLDAPWFKSSTRLCAYISCRPLREVDTSKLLAYILQSSDKDKQGSERKTLYVPRVEDKSSHMRMFNISSLDDLIANSMDILEPAPIDSEGNQREDVMHASEGIDLLLLPGLAFDKSGRRLGRGGGYYDTFLKNYQELVSKQNWKKPLLVALSYSVQILEDGEIPTTPNDINVDALVSPTGVIPISPDALQRMKYDV